MREIGEGESDEEEEGQEAVVDSTLHTAGLEDEDMEKRKRAELKPRDVDAYWLQRSLRNLSETYRDPHVAQQKAKEILEILKVRVAHIISRTVSKGFYR